LALDGIDDARRAGKILKQHGFEFDVLYTSWLARAIQTGMYVLDELDCTWVPIIKVSVTETRGYDWNSSKICLNFPKPLIKVLEIERTYV
jgi:2,3-bisphosphoglycerate-dependent phosphoglycerate mutase